jgi:hypothetical protein
MRDATGVGVYCDSVLMAYRPPKEATKLQHMGSEFVNISGSENLEKALTLGCSKYTDGIWIVLFSAVPYAERVNDLGSPKMRGARYFDKFESWLLAEVKSRVSGINNFPVGFHYE